MSALAKQFLGIFLVLAVMFAAVVLFRLVFR